jgi:uncharacterized protein YndB with AHSA1/START domain
MLINLLLVLVLLVVVVLLLAAFRPKDFRVVRSRTIGAPPAALFALVNDFRQWTQWSPWEKVDPAMQRAYDGSAAGAGARYAWVGNNQIGQGSMTILESLPPELIRIKIEFLKPMAGVCDIEFSFKADGDRTLVTWSMGGCHSFMARVMGLFMNLDKMTGGFFEQGLAELARITEAKPELSPTGARE